MPGPLYVCASKYLTATFWLFVVLRRRVRYLAGEEATHADDAEDVEHGRAHDGPHPHVTFGDKHPWEESDTRTRAHTHAQAHTHGHYNTAEWRGDCSPLDIYSCSTAFAQLSKHM